MKPCTSSFTGLPETLTALPARQIQLRLNSYHLIRRDLRPRWLPARSIIDLRK
jgi:hypothetical protein